MNKQELVNKITKQIQAMKPDCECPTWQSMMNAFHEYWKTDGSLEYIELINMVEANYPTMAMAVLLGKYHYQVENGGHAQYIDNGYANGLVGFFRPNRDRFMAEAHCQMIRLFESTTMSTSETGQRVLQAMNKMLDMRIDDHDGEYQQYDCFDCEGTGYYDDEQEEMCVNCNGSGMYEEFEENPNYGEMDDMWLEKCDDLLFPNNFNDDSFSRMVEDYLAEEFSIFVPLL